MAWHYYLFYVAAAFFASYNIFRFVRSYFRWYTTPLNKLAGPKRGFLFGTFLEVLRRPFMDAHFEWWDEAGKNDTDLIHYTQIFGGSSVLVLNADHVKRILLANYRQPRYAKNFSSLERILGKGLVTLEGEDWNHHRRIIHPSFQVGFLKSNLDSHVPSRVAKLLSCWKKAGPDRTIDVYSHFSMLTLDILGAIAFAHDFQGIQTVQHWSESKDEGDAESLPQVSDRLIRAMTRSMQASSKRILLSILGLNFLDREGARTRQATDDAVAEVITKARQRIDPRGASSSIKDGKYAAKSVLEALMNAKDTESKDGKRVLEESELQAEVKTFIVAGHETTSTWCYWATYCLSRYPEIQERVYQDIIKHAPLEESDNGINEDGIDLETVEKMKYFNAFLKEVLRLYAPVGMIIRYCTRDEDFDSVIIPRKTRLVVPIYLLHRSPRYWKDPDAFQPERWLGQEAPFSHSHAYLPFSHGPRNCIGYRFATMEAKLIMAAIIQKVRFEFTPELRDTEFKLTSYVTVKAKPAVKVNAKFRE